jgi:hypothetical protein
MSDERGQLPTWWRRCDELARQASKTGARRMSDRTLLRIRFVVVNGSSELIAAMDAERVSIAAAAELARTPADIQMKCIANPKLRREVVAIIRENDEDQ